MIDRGKGWIQDRVEIVSQELADKSFASVLRVGSTIPSPIDFSQLLDFVPDQKSTSSCVGQAFATSLYLTAKIAGTPIPRPSAKAIYDFARLKDQPRSALEDLGSRPLAALDCLLDVGILPEEGEGGWAIEFDSFGRAININEPPPLDIYQSALAAKLDAYYRIAPGPGAGYLIRQALAKGYCPVFAMPVDETFERWNTASIYEGRKGSILGWHMQAISGFGDGYIQAIGSWGVHWANNGLIKIASDYFDSGECLDIIVPTIV